MDVLLQREIKNCFPVLVKQFDEGSLNQFRLTPKQNLFFYHFGLGTFIRNHFLKPRDFLYPLFLKEGITQQDEMSEIIIDLFHDFLNDACHLT